MKKLILVSFLFVLGLMGCASVLENRSLFTPSPAKSAFFTTIGAGFSGIAKDGKVVNLRYALSIKLNKKSEDDLLLGVCFENPEDYKNPICTEATLKKGESEITLTSPVVRGLNDRQNYEVIVTIWDHHNTMPLGKHTQLVRYYDVNY